jgi:putative ABC transport system permease protein
VFKRLLDALPGEAWKIAVDTLSAHKVRTVLSTIGILVGSASMVLVVTASLSGGRYVLEQIESVGSNLVYTEHVKTGNQTSTLSDELSLSDIEAVRSIPAIAEVAGTRTVPMTVIADGERGVTLIGVTDGYQRIRHLVISRGRYFDHDEIASGTKVTLLTEHLADLMFPQQNPVGAIARVGELRLSVIGVFRERVSTFGLSEIQHESALVPFRLMRSFTGSELVGLLYAQAASPDAVPQVTREVSRVLSSRHRTGARYQVDNLAGLLAVARKVSIALTVTLLAVSLIALSVSGIGIMNVMLVTVTERTREIGIRKSVGASRRTILGQFLIEAALISGGGAVAGVVLAVIALLLVRRFVPAGVSLPVSGWSIVLALTVSSSVGVVFGYLPARRAADLQPVDALRYE